jgi:betaine lipid synthase
MSDDKQAKLRRKLVTNELNPVADFMLSIVLLCFIPFIYMSSLLHDKLMYKFLNKTYIYNVSWEDPRMDQRVFDLCEKDHVLTIASAGDNCFDYIIEGAKVTGVDFNSCQIALTELKVAACLELDFEQFFDIFSNSNMQLLKSVYHSKLRKHLCATSAAFWDEGVDTIKSFMYSGTSGSMAYLALRVIFPMFGLGFIREEIEKDTPMPELQKKLGAWAYSIRAIAWLMDNIMLRGGCCFAGVPERQMNLGIHRPNNLAIVTEKIMFETDLVNDNYFYAGYFLGYYKKHNAPRYLREEHFAALKKNLAAGKLTLFHGTLLQAIKNATVPFTVASLLDHMDWMTDEMITEEISALTNGKMDMERGKIFWRTFADDVHASPLTYLNGQKVDDHDDRVCMYWTTWISHLKDVKVDFHNKVDTFKPRSFVSNLITGAKIVTFPVWKPLVAGTLSVTGQAKNMEAFYKYQKNDYDAFRESLLWARPALIQAMPLRKGGGMVWVDVGGGTARNLEYFTPETVRKYFKKIYILDVSASLLEVASERVKRMGLEDIVEVIEHDFTAESVFSVMPKQNTVDIISMSYSFSMIPNKAGAMLNAAKLIKAPNAKGDGSTGGLIMIADFFQKGKYDDLLPFSSRLVRQMEASFHKWWFAQDHVHLLTEQELELGSHLLECAWDDRFRGSVPFIPFMKPYHGVYILKRK